MVKCKIEYTGGLRCKLQHSLSGMTVSTDAPVDNHGKGESFSPTDLMCSAMAACMATIMGIYAEKENVNLDGLSIEVGKVMSANPRRIARIETVINVPLPENTEHKEALYDCVIGSPAMRSLHPDIEVPITWNWLG
ncbi:MAG: OsmC family protein [Akkermansia sp.]|nr:OsmC family protein [Akkermansia sp.]